MNLRVVNEKISRFKLMSSIGVIAAVIQSGAILHALSTNIWLLLVMIAASAVAFICLAILIKVLTGKNDHVMLRYFIAILLFNYFIIKLLNQPLFPYMEILALGYGTIIFFGRFGCYLAGCCHGRPNSFGVCYGHDKVKKGFPNYYSGVRLFPIQIVEAIGILTIVCISILALLKNPDHGIGLTVFITLYGLLRFVLEFFRGDPERPYFLSFSEAQWTILFLFAALTVSSLWEIIELSNWQILIHLLLASAFLSIGAARIIRPQLRINEPPHVKELMSIKLDMATRFVKVHTTLLGIQISGCKMKNETHYTISATKMHLDHRAIENLKMILSIKHRPSSCEILNKHPGIFNLIFISKSE